MDATSLPPAGTVAAISAPIGNPATPEPASDSDQGFWQTLASATEVNSGEAPVDGSEERQNVANTTVVAPWIPPTLVSGFPLPSLPVQTAPEAGVTRIFGSPTGIIPGSIVIPASGPAGSVAPSTRDVGTSPAGVIPGSAAIPSPAQATSGVASARELAGARATEQEAATSSTSATPRIAESVPATFAAAVPTVEIVAVNATTAAGTTPAPATITAVNAENPAPTGVPIEAPLAEPAPAPVSAVNAQGPAPTGFPMEAPLAEPARLRAAIPALDRPVLEETSLMSSDLTAGQRATNTAAIAAGIAVASGQTALPPHGTQAQPVQAAIAQVADGEASAPSTPLLPPRGIAVGEGASSVTAQLFVASQARSTAAAPPATAQPFPVESGVRVSPELPGTTGEGVTPSRFDLRVTDDGVEPVTRSQSDGPRVNDGFANLLGGAAGAAPNIGPAPLTVAHTLSQSLSEDQSRALVDHVVQQASLLRFPDRTEMTVELTPPNLGTVHLHLTQGGGSLSVHMRADDPHVQQVLAGNIEQLTARLHEQGHTVSVDLRWDREAPHEAPDQGYQRDSSPREQTDPRDTPKPRTDDVQPRRLEDRRIDYRA